MRRVSLNVIYPEIPIQESCRQIWQYFGSNSLYSSGCFPTETVYAGFRDKLGNIVGMSRQTPAFVSQSRLESFRLHRLCGVPSPTLNPRTLTP
jgi:hypothetical protein